MTEKEKVEESLKVSEESKRTLIEAIPDMIVQCDTQGNILFANQAFEMHTGLSSEGQQKLDWRKWVHPEDLENLSTEIRQFISSSDTQSKPIEGRMMTPQGETRWVSGRLSKLRIEDRMVLQAVSRDITQRKANEDELQKYRLALEELVEERTAKLQETQRKLFQSWKMASMGTLTSGVAHELNNPLNFIMGSYEELVRYFNSGESPDPETEQYILSNLKSGLDRSIHILKGLHQFSGDSGERNASCDIHAMINNCLIMLKSELSERFVVSTQFAEKDLLTEGNVGELHQVFFIILRNAIESVPDEGEITIVTRELEEQVQIEIADTGKGIRQEDLSRITDPFFTTKAHGEGIGLGLSIAYNIVLAHKGTLDFESEEAQGTKVCINLPRSLVETLTE